MLDLAQKLEGGLFVEIGMFSFSGNSFTFTKDFYTVKNGLVYIVNDGLIKP